MLTNRDEQSVGGALFQTAGQIGGSLGICLSALISSEVTKDAGSLLVGLKGAYWFSAGTAFISESHILSLYRQKHQISKGDITRRPKLIHTSRPHRSGGLARRGFGEKCQAGNVIPCHHVQKVCNPACGFMHEKNSA